MQDKTLLLTALITSIIGVFMLFFLSQNIDFNKSSLIDPESIDKTITLTATITNVDSSEKVTEITALTLQEIKIIVFEELNLTEGTKIEIKGKLKKNNEIIAEEINQISYLNN